MKKMDQSRRTDISRQKGPHRVPRRQVGLAAHSTGFQNMGRGREWGSASGSSAFQVLKEGCFQPRNERRPLIHADDRRDMLSDALVSGNQTTRV